MSKSIPKTLLRIEFVGVVLLIYKVLVEGCFIVSPLFKFSFIHNFKHMHLLLTKIADQRIGEKYLFRLSRKTWNVQKQPSRGVLSKRCSDNMQQIYRRTLMPKCDFKKAALQLYWNHTSVWVFYCKFAAYFKNTFY